MRKKLFVMLLCIIFTLCGCQERVDEKQLPEEHTEYADEEAEQTGLEYQQKLEVIEPSAYGNVDGLDLEKGTVLSVIGKCETGAFWQAVKAGTEQAAADINVECGYEGKDKVKVVYSGPAKTENVDEQVNILDEELSRYPKALAISITDVNACQIQFDLAAESDIPIVAFDSGSDYKGLMAMIATDNKKAAKEAAMHMAEKVEKGEIVVIAHDSKSETAHVRESVFKKTIKKEYPQLKVANTYYLDLMQQQVAEEVNAGTYSLGEEEPTGEPLAEIEKIDPADITIEDIMKYILVNNPDMAGCYATNIDAVTGILDAIEALNKENITLIGYDEDEKTTDAVKDGKIEGLIVQNPFGMGYASVIAAARSALELGNEAFVDTGYVWMTKENVESDEIQKMLYH